MVMFQRFFSHVVVRNALVLYTVQIGTYALPLITVPYLSRVLSPEKLGLVAYAQSFTYYFVTLTEYGFNLTATREIAARREDTGAIARIFSAVMVARLLLLLLGFLILLAVVAAVPTFRASRTLFIVAFLSVVGNALFPMWLFQGVQKIGHVASRDFLSKIAGLAGLFIFVHGDGDYVWAAGVQSGAIILAGAVGLTTALWTLRVRFQWPAWITVWEVLKTGWPVFVSTAATTLTAPTNVTILGLRSSATEVAYFTNAQRVISPLRALVTPMVTAIYPHVAQKGARSEEDAVHFVRKYAKHFVLPFLLGGAILLVAAPWVVRILMGARYAPAVVLIRMMAFSPFLLALSHVFSSYYMLACGHDKAWMRICLTTVLANFVVLVPLLALLPGSWALAATVTVVDIYSCLMYFRFYRRHAPKR
jgi:PST family polysaccharide transporter